jgi:hypothetical protein
VLFATLNYFYCITLLESAEKSQFGKLFLDLTQLYMALNASQIRGLSLLEEFYLSKLDKRDNLDHTWLPTE